MKNMEIEPGIIIENIEEVLEGLYISSNSRRNDLERVCSFIKEEHHTKFYINHKLHSQMVEEDTSLYLWLDTGLVTHGGSPLFISLIQKEDIYIGHYYGTADTLAKSVREHFYRYRKEINQNLQKFKNKYEKRVQNRTNRNLLEKSRVSIVPNKTVPVKTEPLIKEPTLKPQHNPLYKIQGNKIILDLEFCSVDKEQKEMKELSRYETIQFGAVKLDANNEIIGRYESLVKPRYSHIDEAVSNLTNITDEIVSNAPDYIEIINGFLDWAGSRCTTTDFIK